MTDITRDCFGILFFLSNPTLWDIDAALHCTDYVVDQSKNDILCEPFTDHEIRRAVFDLHPSKAPCLDSFTALFYQKLWPGIGNE